jgi:hypothetical protein
MGREGVKRPFFVQAKPKGVFRGDFSIYQRSSEGSAKLPLAGWGARSGPFGVFMSLKRRVREGDGRARAVNTPLVHNIRRI